MKAYLRLALATSVLVLGTAALAEGCGTGDRASDGSTFAASSVGAEMVECNGAPDGFCDRRNVTPEGCGCPDCYLTAFCTNGCVNDGMCVLSASGEDCTCADCANTEACIAGTTASAAVSTVASSVASTVSASSGGGMGGAAMSASSSSAGPGGAGGLGGAGGAPSDAGAE